MDEILPQKIMRISFPIREHDLGMINEVINNGYEISILVPDLAASGGGIYTNRRGLYTTGVLFIFSPSVKRTTLHYHSVSRDNGKAFVDKIDEIIKQENEKGYMLNIVIPGTAVVEPMEGNGLGKGTYFFGLFFIGPYTDE